MSSDVKEKTQREKDHEILVPFGDELWNGKYQMRPKSRGRKYDEPPTDGTFCEDQVDQTAAAATDLNRIMKRYEKTGELAELIELGMTGNTGMRYGDFTDAPTFQEAMDIFNHANDQFTKLDAPIRARFDNDPRRFLEFVSDERNAEELYTMGLAVRQPPKEAEVTLKDINETLKNGQGKKKSPPAEE